LTKVKDFRLKQFYTEIKDGKRGHIKMKRKIITIDEESCNGCGNCVSACSEGALQIINGTARLVKEDFCDGFGDCMGGCPTGALKIEEKESMPFDIEATKDYLLRTQGEEAVNRMEEAQKKHVAKEYEPMACGCPGSLARSIDRNGTTATVRNEISLPQLRNWPVQIHLLPAKAPYYQGADLLVAADCCAYAYAGFHGDFIKEHTVAIGCPKLDNADSYLSKLTAIIGGNDIHSVEVAYMEVPCCSGMVRLVEEAVRASGKNIPVKKKMIGIRGQAVS
jgi:NAD-dependent dihydropyrimidine dehydrogenase PreA subunit